MNHRGKGNRRNTEYTEFLTRTVRIVLPIAFQYLMLAMVAVSDTFMLGRLEQNKMAAVSLATQIQFVQNIMISSVVSATSILGAQYWGRQDRKSLRHIVCIGLMTASAFSICTFLGCMFLPGRLMKIFTNEQVLIEIGVGYLKIAGWSYLLTGITQIFLTAMKVSEHVVQTAVISSVTVVLNVALNAILIFGIGPAPAMGVEGAALATLISRIVEMLWAVICSMGAKYVHPHWKDFFSLEWVLVKDFCKCALPLLGACLFWGVGFSSYTAFMGHLGTDAAAANSVTAVVRDLICCLADGLSAGGGILVGNELGAGRLDTGKLYGNRIVKIAFVIGVLSSLLMLCCTPFLLKAVKLTEQAGNYLRWMMVVMAVYMIGRTVNAVIINGILAAGGDTMFDFYSLAVTMWGIAVPLAAAGTFLWNFPVILVYACTCLDEVGKIPWVLYHYRKYKWVKDLTRKL